jgi:hypothetical protein
MLTGGNGTPQDALPSNSLDQIVTLLQSIEHRLDVQFKRIAEIQLQLDRAIADRPLMTRP